MDPAASLPLELIAMTLSSTAPESLCAASCVSRQWRAGAGCCWPAKLAEHFALTASSDAAARRSFACEHGWRRKRYRYVAVPLEPPESAVAALFVDAASSSALVATSDGRCLRVGLPSAAADAECELAGLRLGHAAGRGAVHDNTPPRERPPLTSFSAPLELPTSAAAACARGAAFGFEDGSIEAVGGWAAGAPCWNAAAAAAPITAVELLPDTAAGATDGGEWRPRVLSGCAFGEVVLSEVRFGGEGGGGTRELLRLCPASGTCFAGGGHRAEVGVTALAAGPAEGGGGGGVALAGSSGGHVSVVDLQAGALRGAILSSCACAPLRLAVLADGRGRALYAVSRRHGFTGSGHADVVTLYDARSLDKAGTCPSGPPGRSTKGEGIVGLHADAHKLVTAAAHGVVVAYDMRTWRPLFTRHTGAARRAAPGEPALSAVHFDGGWVAAGGGATLHFLVNHAASV